MHGNLKNSNGFSRKINDLKIHLPAGIYTWVSLCNGFPRCIIFLRTEKESVNHLVLTQ